jgi:hypothetical protein
MAQSLNTNITITYNGLTIKGGSGNNFIDNDAKNGIVHDGNGTDTVILGGAGAKATLGPGAHDTVAVGSSDLGTHEAAGSALGDKVTFGSAATALLLVGTGAEAGSTAGTASVGLTKVLNAADGMEINFTYQPLHCRRDRCGGISDERHGGRECSSQRNGRCGRSLLQLPR